MKLDGEVVDAGALDREPSELVGRVLQVGKRRSAGSNHKRGIKSA